MTRLTAAIERVADALGQRVPDPHVLPGRMPQRAGDLALPLGLARIFRHHLWRHPREKWRPTEDGTVRCGCSCGRQLELGVGLTICPTEGCDRIWIWTSQALFHAHPDQLATGQEEAQAA